MLMVKTIRPKFELSILLKKMKLPLHSSRYFPSLPSKLPTIQKPFSTWLTFTIVRTYSVKSYFFWKSQKMLSAANSESYIKTSIFAKIRKSRRSPIREFKILLIYPTISSIKSKSNLSPARKTFKLTKKSRPPKSSNKLRKFGNLSTKK